MKTSIRIVNMTSTEIYKSQIESTMDHIRHLNTGNTKVTFEPYQLGGIFGQREILANNGVMRQIKLSN